jgi:hypothetical protein
VKKKKHVTLSGSNAGTMLYSALHADDPHVQLLCSILTDCKRFEAAAEELCQLAEQATVMEHNKLAEHRSEVSYWKCFIMGTSLRRCTIS